MGQAQCNYVGVVYPWQCDHMGHLNVTWYVNKFDEATWSFFASLGMTRARMSESGVGMAALEQHITYKRELLPGDIVAIHTRPTEINNKTLRFVHEMANRDTGEIAAVCQFLVVCLDTKMRKGVALPQDVAARARILLPP